MISTAAIGAAIRASVNGGAITIVTGVVMTIPRGMAMTVAIGHGPSIDLLIFTPSRFMSRHRFTLRRDAHPASVCIFRSINIGKNLPFAHPIPQFPDSGKLFNVRRIVETKSGHHVASDV